MVLRHQATIPMSLIFLAVSLAAASRSVWDGVYAKEQAARGEAEYLNHCARCHGENLLGGEESPALVEEDFLAKWNGKTAGELVERIRKTMPTDGPGTLSQKQCTDVTAYLLSVNEFPAGEKEMASDLTALNEIRIEPKR
jgi:mono/diheme cytochrome c family protein